MKFSRSSVISLLLANKCKKFEETTKCEVWLTEKKYMIRIPTEDRIHIDIVELIALDILQIGTWEFDYWIGQNSVN